MILVDPFQLRYFMNLWFSCVPVCVHCLLTWHKTPSSSQFVLILKLKQYIKLDLSFRLFKSTVWLSEISNTIKRLDRTMERARVKYAASTKLLKTHNLLERDFRTKWRGETIFCRYQFQSNLPDFHVEKINWVKTYKKKKKSDFFSNNINDDEGQ